MSVATTLEAILEAIEREHWDAYKRVDVAAHDAILTDDYVAISPDGSVRTGKPTAQEMAATPIGGYAFQDFQAVTIAPGVALVTFVAEVEIPGVPNRFRFRVSELWIERRGAWLQRFYQGTLLK
jgi:glyoxylase I family protein